MTHCDMLILGGARRRVDLGHILITPNDGRNVPLRISGGRWPLPLSPSLLLAASIV